MGALLCTGVEAAACCCGSTVLATCCACCRGCCNCPSERSRKSQYLSLRAAKVLYMVQLALACIAGGVVMAYGPSSGWFVGKFEPFGPSSSSSSSDWPNWLPHWPTLEVSNPVATILLTQCNASLVVRNSTARGLSLDAEPSSFVQVAAECLGDAAAQRISFGTAVYFVFGILVSLMGVEWHRGMWLWKFLLHTALIVGAFFVPSSWGEPIAVSARVAAGLFLFAQVCVMVDIAYKLHDELLRRIEARDEELKDEYSGPDDQPGYCSNLWKVLYIVLALSLWLASAAGVISLIAKEASAGGDCAGGTAVLTASLVIAIVYTVLSMVDCIAPASGAKGFLPPSVIFAYCTWLLFSALGGLPSSNCNPVPSVGSDGSPGSIVVAILIATLSVGYSAYSASVTVPGLFSAAPPAPAEGIALLATKERRHSSHDVSDEESRQAKPSDEEQGGSSARRRYSSSVSDAAPTESGGGCGGEDRTAWAFHLILCAAALYMAVVLTGWQVPTTGQFEVTSAANSGTPHFDSQQTIAAFWAQTAAAIFAVALYGWTLVAELCCPGRTFS
jgi:hypothetical protein